MEIKVNDYVRIKKGRIGKVKSIKDDSRFKFEKYTLDIKYWNGNIRCSEEQIIKSSPNIIDLIEENDVIKFWYEKEKTCYVYKVNDKLCVWDGFQDRPIKNIHIISILTKEMFEQMEYKVGE